MLQLDNETVKEIIIGQAKKTAFYNGSWPLEEIKKLSCCGQRVYTDSGADTTGHKCKGKKIIYSDEMSPNHPGRERWWDYLTPEAKGALVYFEGGECCSRCSDK